MSAPGGERTIDALTMTLLMVCLGLIAGVLVLASQNVRLKKELGSHTIRSADQVDLFGMTFPPLELRDRAGAPTTIEFGEKGALLMVFSSDCPDCVATLPDWEELFIGDKAIKPDMIPSYGIQLDMPQPDLEDPDTAMVKTMPFPVLGPADETALRHLRQIPIIPAALVLDMDGMVIKAWPGRPTDDLLEEIRDFIAG
jgi:hypothetical protein